MAARTLNDVNYTTVAYDDEYYGQDHDLEAWADDEFKERQTRHDDDQDGRRSPSVGVT